MAERIDAESRQAWADLTNHLLGRRCKEGSCLSSNARFPRRRGRACTGHGGTDVATSQLSGRCPRWRWSSPPWTLWPISGKLSCSRRRSSGQPLTSRRAESFLIDITPVREKPNPLSGWGLGVASRASCPPRLRHGVLRASPPCPVQVGACAIRLFVVSVTWGWCGGIDQRPGQRPSPPHGHDS